jgi:hypothetical protein
MSSSQSTAARLMIRQTHRICHSLRNFTEYSELRALATCVMAGDISLPLSVVTGLTLVRRESDFNTFKSYTLVAKYVNNVREMLKVVRVTPMLGQQFRTAQIEMGLSTTKEVPNLDVENRWNSMFMMLESCFQTKDIFEALCKMPIFSGRLTTLSDLEWQELKTLKDFLEPAYELTTDVSGSK